jgi:hypothetical protein
VGLVYDPTELPGVMTVRLGVAGVLQNGIRADPRGFTCAYESVKKDTVVYGSEMWVHTHDTWVLWEGHGMVRILLTGRMVYVCQYWMYERGQEGMFLAWG